MEQDILIQKYLSGTLSKEENLSFTELLENDVDFAEKVAEHTNIQKAIQATEREELKTYLQSLESKNTKKSNPIFNKKWLAIAAIFLMLISVTYYQFSLDKDTNELYATYFEPYPNALYPITRGQNKGEKAQLFAAYEIGDYITAKKGFQNMLNSNYDADIQFYYTMSLLNLGDIETAHKNLQVLKKETTLFTPQLYWYSALIALKKGEKDQVRIQLDSLENLKSGYKMKESLALLKVLE
ncbi:hypothetical protein IMCC3317_10110 [Kordia antarctica]|uniref:Tetratricopeptide repeat protein n=1 Tax=Kordia antarctica TaxID=1218801 RepID=A0A7L4ZGA0_9FLAO|nr:hypothetical protein [Kordia antarctica]QHI35665.1 hypothetical protein IMCC3317_10110 [Kordia antarctica]